MDKITFQELIQYGRDNGGNIVDGMPWSFTYKGHPITHVSDQLYSVGIKCLKMLPSDMLIITDDGSAVVVEKPTGTEALVSSPDGPTPERYKWSWQGMVFDFYRLCGIVGVTHPAQAHAMKKVIRAGKSVKPIERDIDEAIDALLRWKEMLKEDAADTRPPGSA